MINKTTIALFTIISGLMFAIDAKAQQQAFNYTQYMDNLTPLNPAYSMIDKAASVYTVARKEWVGIEGAPSSYQLNANIPFEPIGAAAGLIVLNNQLAIERLTEANFYFAKSIQLESDAYLAVAINAGIKNYVADYSSLDASDPTFQNDIREFKPNVGLGVMYYTDRYYIGISVPELTLTSLGTASVQNNSFKSHYYLSGAIITDLGEDIKLKPSALVSYISGSPVIANISGIIYLKETIGIGADYQTNNQVAGIITLNMSAFHLGYSYRFGSSSNNFNRFNNGIHEVTLGFRFGQGALNNKLL